MRLIALLFISLLGMILAACGGDSSGGNDDSRPIIISLQVTPVITTIPVGFSQHFIAIATLSDGTTKDVTNDTSLTWTSSDDTIAPIVSNQTSGNGMVTGVSAGSVTITASGEANGQRFSATAQVTITNSVVTELQITPKDSSLAIGLSERLKGEAILSDGQVLDVTVADVLNWSSSNPAVATISSSGANKGMVTGVSAGSVTITASGEANGQRFSATAQVTITNSVVTELQITPKDSSLAIGLSKRLKGEATLSDGQVLDVTANDAVSWSSSNPAVATIISSGANKGMVTGVSAGSVTITASGEANGQRFSATAQVTITNSVVTELQITPKDSSLAIGLSKRLKGEATLSDGQVLDVTANDAVSWSSSNPAVATIISSGANKGMVTGVSAGSVTITASGQANGQRFSATAQVTITNSVVTELQITPKDSSLAIGLSERLKGEATLSDGQVLDVTANDAVSWSSSNPAVATIISSGANKGMVTGVSAGSVTITASGEANGQRFSATAQVTITNSVVTELQITPKDSSLAIGLSKRLKGEATLSDGQVLDVTANDAVSWSSSNPAVATIISSGANKGMVTGVSAGSVTITASGQANGQRFSATAQVTITSAVVTELQITPKDSSLAIGLSKRLKGEATLSDGQVLDVTANDAVSWSSSNPAVATIISSGANKGMVTGVSAGSVTITASGEANGQRFSATAEVEVKAPLALFTPPDTNNARTWKDADAYCKGLTPAARLPTVAELQNLFIQSTSATSINQQDNFEMCDVHGWPLGFARCGGITSYYWTNTLGSFGSYHRVSLARGHDASAGEGNDGLRQVACIR